MVARGLSADAQGRRGGGGRPDGRGLRERLGGQPPVALGTREVGNVLGATGATGAYPERHRRRDPPHRHSDAGGQSAPAGDRHAAGTDLRGGLLRLLVRVPAATIGARCPGQSLEADHVERGKLSLGSRHTQVFRHAGSCPSAGVSPTTDTRWCGAAIDREVAQRGRNGSPGR